MRTKPKTVTVLRIPHYLMAFDSAEAATKALGLLAKATPVRYAEQGRGVTDGSADDRSCLTLECGVKYTPRPEHLALPERGTHPDLHR